jgi:hypothetical protein
MKQRKLLDANKCANHPNICLIGLEDHHCVLYGVKKIKISNAKTYPKILLLFAANLAYLSVAFFGTFVDAYLGHCR